MKHASWDGRSVSGAVRYALLMSAFATLAATNHVRAADAAAADAASDSDSEPALQEVVVTGSLIKRSDFETPSPVQVITSESITQQGYTSVSQALSALSANGQGSLSASNPEAFASGGSGVALRGLTVGATLTLIDGERMVAYPISDDGERSFVDTSSIPLLAVERIDVLKDGASSEYGSDAIAGVVNVVLKKNYQGFETTAEAGITNHDDGASERIGFIGGIGDLAGDGYNAWLAVEWRHQDSVLDVNRTSGSWSRTNWAGYGGTNATVGNGSTFNNTGNGNPFPNAAGPYLVPASATSYQSPGVVFLTPACPSAAALTADKCTWYNQTQDRQQIQPQTGNLDIIGRFTKSLGENWQGVLTTSMFRSEGEQVFTPATADPQGPNAPYQNTYFGPNVAGLGITPPVILTIPTTNPMNTTGSPLYPIGLLGEFGYAQNTQVVTNTYRTYLDFSGKELGWDLDAQFGMMYANTGATYLGAVNYPALQTAFDNGYVLGSGGALAAGISTPVVSHFSNSLQVVDIHASRALFDLPGGPLSLAIGAGWNHKYLDAVQSPDASDGTYAINDAYAYGGQTDISAFGEIVAPVAKGAELDAAVRWDHYNNTGGDGVPKFGAKWSPFETFMGDDAKWVTLRGTYGKGFRAPNPAEYSHAGSSFGLGNFADNALCPSATANPVYPQFNLSKIQATPQAGDVAEYCNFSPAFFQVTNPNLKPERSTNFTWGAIFQPIDQVSISADFWNIVVENVIVNPAEFPSIPFAPAPVSNVRTGPVTLPVLQANGTTVNTLFPGGEPLESTTGYENAAKIHVDGIDLDIAARFDLGVFGKISPSLNWSHEIVWNFSNCYEGDCYEAHLAGTHGPSAISGDTGNPKDRGVFTLSWDKGPVDVTWTVNYTGPFTVTDPSAEQNDCTAIFGYSPNKFQNGALPSGYCVVKEFVDVNLYGSYKVTEKLQVFGSVANLFNTKPPTDLATYGNGGYLSSGPAYDPSFAQAGALGMFFDVGFKWKL